MIYNYMIPGISIEYTTVIWYQVFQSNTNNFQGGVLMV